jgi:galactokinase
MHPHAETIERQFHEKFGAQTNHIVVRSPGRVNLIGEHTDYNEGFVLPAAIDKAIIFAVAPRNDRRLHFVAVDLKDEYEGSIDELQKSSKGWPNYLLGIIDQLKKAGHLLGGVNAVFGGDVPIGAGLSSSAAMEGGFICALNDIFSLFIDKFTLVKMSQKAEHEFAGVNCGIMDQFINIFGEDHKVLKIDCRSLEYEYFPFKRDDLQIVLCETPTQRSLASSEYNIRRRQCEAGVAVLKKYDNKITSLRDVELDFLLDHRKDLEPIIFKRCEYVVRENVRVLLACEDLKRNDLSSFGLRMFDSHSGLRDDYEVSSKELDFLVDIATGLPGVLGSRMMGAGFGGCTISLVQNADVEQFVEMSKSRFLEWSGQAIKVHTTSISTGVSKQ